VSNFREFHEPPKDLANDCLQADNMPKKISFYFNDLRMTP
jgi:hypothetical protein